MSAGMSSAKTARHHHLLLKQGYSRRRTKATQLERARLEIKNRTRPLVSRLESSGRSTLRVNAATYEPYTTRYGKQMTTAMIRQALPPYYGIRLHATRNGDAFNGWLLVRTN